MTKLRCAFVILIAGFGVVVGPLANAAIPASERAVLVDLYNDTSGGNWSFNTGWNGTPGTECNWYGINCDSASAHVTSIQLNGNNLQGSLPAITALTALQTFNVSGNNLSGTIPSLSGLAQLQTFSVDLNNFRGGIPALQGLTSLVAFDAGYNNLGGALPTLSGLVHLQGFNASHNRMSGVIPALIGLTALNTFDIDSNALTGAIPALTGLTNLQTFYAFGNQLSGSIPALSGLSSLQYFDVNTNQLTGSIPALTDLTALQNFNVDANQLSGSIPLLTGLSDLNVFDVGNNALSGAVPATPSPDHLLSGYSVLCPNALSASFAPDWDAATGTAPWYSACDLTLDSVNLDQHGITGSWYNPATSGQGIEMEVYPDLGGAGKGLLYGDWFTFDVTAAGGQRWYALSGNVNNSSSSAQLTIGVAANGGNFNAPPVVAATAVGQATIEFGDCNTASLSYTFTDGSGRSGTIPLSRLTTNITCGASGDNGQAPTDYLLSGAWYDPNTSGQGLMFDVNPTQSLLFAAWYTFLPQGTQQTGNPTGQQWYSLNTAVGSFVDGATQLNDIQIGVTTGGVFDSPTPTAATVQVGTASIAFQSCNAMTLTYTFTSGTNLGLHGTINLVRVGPTPTGCSL